MARDLRKLLFPAEARRVRLGRLYKAVFGTDEGREVLADLYAATGFGVEILVRDPDGPSEIDSQASLAWAAKHGVGLHIATLMGQNEQDIIAEAMARDAREKHEQRDHPED